MIYTGKPRPHGLGKRLWGLCNRKLDALFVIYILGWRTEEHKPNKCRFFTRKVDGKWVSDMLPYIHDGGNLITTGIETLRQANVFVETKSCQDGYSVKINDIEVIDDDARFAQMAAMLLSRGVKPKDIQDAWDCQFDYVRLAAIRAEKEEAKQCAEIMTLTRKK